MIAKYCAYGSATFNAPDMVDLILPRRARTSNKPSQRPESKAAHVAVPPSSDTYIVGKVSKTIRGANELLLYWKDGLTAQERAAARSKEERKQVLSLHMKTVSLNNGT